MPIAGGHREAETLEPSGLEGGQDGLVHHHGAAEYLGDRRLGAIVGGRTEAAGRDHRAGAIKRLAYGRRDTGRIITDGRAARDGNAEAREFTPDVRGVGVDGEAEQKLVTDGDDFEGEGHSGKLTSHERSTRSACREGRRDALREKRSASMSLPRAACCHPPGVPYPAVTGPRPTRRP